MEPLWSPVVATSGNRWQMGMDEQPCRNERGNSLGHRSQSRQRRMERLWSRAVATDGSRSQWDAAERGSDRRKRLRWVATGCRRVRMVRRGSAVRVRQRALILEPDPRAGGGIRWTKPVAKHATVADQSERDDGLRDIR
jgi:hypothetical protein